MRWASIRMICTIGTFLWLKNIILITVTTLINKSSMRKFRRLLSRPIAPSLKNIKPKTPISMRRRMPFVRSYSVRNTMMSSFGCISLVMKELGKNSAARSKKKGENTTDQNNKKPTPFSIPKDPLNKIQGDLHQAVLLCSFWSPSVCSWLGLSRTMLWPHPKAV